MVEQILLIVLIVLVLIVLLVVLLRRRIETTDIEPALSRMWNRSGIAEKVGELTTRARDIQEAHKSIEQMLRVPKERASFGEISLETILSDQLPPRDVRHEGPSLRREGTGRPYQVDGGSDLYRLKVPSG